MFSLCRQQSWRHEIFDKNMFRLSSLCQWVKETIENYHTRNYPDHMNTTCGLIPYVHLEGGAGVQTEGKKIYHHLRHTERIV